MKPAAFQTPTDTQVQAVRTFDAPVDLVWKPFTEPEWVARWMLGPPGWAMPVCEMDFRVGGTYENRFRNETDGAEFGWVGEFREIEMHRKIVQDESYVLDDSGDETGEDAIVTMTFEETAGVTAVTTGVDYASQEARDAAIATGMETAMEMGYRRIDELLVGWTSAAD